MNWRFWRRAPEPPVQKIVLQVMRADHMWRVHPKTDFSFVCDACRQPVGIYPSGQRIIREHGRRFVRLVCNVCEPGLRGQLVPGAEEERAESMWNPYLWR